MSREIAILDEDGVLVAVEPCGEDAYRTDATARIVQLESGHDMRNHLRQYRFNWNAGCFVPLSQAALDVEDRDTSELVEGVVEALEDVTEFLAETTDRKGRRFEMSERSARVIRVYRHKKPRRRSRVNPVVDESAETTVTVDMDVRVKRSD